MLQILIIDDDKNIRRYLKTILLAAGYTPICTETADEALHIMEAYNIALIILDIMLPGTDGFTFTKLLRDCKNDIPILMHTAKQLPDDIKTGFLAGADDYMTKPFSLSVLLLKIEAHFRRRKNEPGTPKIHSKDIVFIPGEMRAFVKEREISLTKNELKMLSFFLQNPKQILSKTQLLENVFDLDGDFMDENTVAVNIRRLREKIEEDPAAPVYIKNIRGLGYIWNQEVSQ